jgi:type I restriction enzyme S subunit
MSGFPKGWKELSIGEVILPFKSIDPTKEPSKEFRYIDIGSIDNSRQTITDPKTFKGNDAPSRARRLVQEGDVLFSTVRTYLKNIATVPSELSGALTSTGISVLRPSARMDSRYLFHWVASDTFVSEISKSQDGTMYPAVSDRDVSSARIAVPPVTEQRRIVAKLDSLTGCTARAREQLGRIPRLIQKYREAILSAAFSGELTKEWREKENLPDLRLGKVAELLIVPIRNGLSIRGSDSPPGQRSLRLSALRSRVVDLDDVRYLPIDDNRASRYLLDAGDVLVSRGNGTKAFVGIASIVPNVEQPTIFPDTAFRIRLSRAKALPDWFTSMWNAPQLRTQIESAAKTTAGIWKISQGDLAAFELLIPHIDEQHEIVRRIETAFGWLDRVATEHANASRLLPKLDQAVLAKAFRGELVLPDR